MLEDTCTGTTVLYMPSFKCASFQKTSVTLHVILRLSNDK